MSYRKVFINPYPEGWVDLPNEDTSISAAALQAHTDAIEKMDSYLEKIGKAEDAGYIQMNMFNMSTVYIGKKLGDEGELVDDPGSMTTDFIEIDDKLQYMLSALNDSECSVKVHAYNSDFEWMMLCAMQTFYDNVVFPFAVINGAKYIKVSLSKDAKEVVLEDGYITHPYLPSNKELAAELSEQKESLIQFKDDGYLPKNLLNKSTDRIGIGMADNGTENTNGNAEMTEYIEVLPNRTCTISWLRTDTNMATRVALYDESKAYISLPIRDVRTEVSAQRYFATFNTTSNTKYLRANFSKAHKDVQIEYGNEMTEYSIYGLSNTDLTQITEDLNESLAQLTTPTYINSANISRYISAVNPSVVDFVGGNDNFITICGNVVTISLRIRVLQAISASTKVFTIDNSIKPYGFDQSSNGIAFPLIKTWDRTDMAFATISKFFDGIALIGAHPTGDYFGTITYIRA